MTDPLTPLPNSVANQFEDGLIEMVDEFLNQAQGEGGMPPEGWQDQLLAYVRANAPKTVKLSGNFDDLVAMSQKPFSGTTDTAVEYEGEAE